jgi:hypothetical protein
VSPESELGRWVLIWTAAAVATVLWRWRSGAVGVGLVPAYLISLALNHWLAAALFTLGVPPVSADLAIVEAGFRQSVYAVLAFGAGSLLLAPLLLGIFQTAEPASSRPREEPSLPLAYLGLGLLCWLVLPRFLGRIPTVAALVSSGWPLAVVGVNLACWQAWQGGRPLRLLLWLLGAVCGLPALTVLSAGFIGYGVAALLAVLSFVGSFYRPRWRVLAVGALLAYGGLTLYVGYMRDRDLIRQAVWGGQDLAARVERISDTVSSLEPFDPNNPSHVLQVDRRLNQNTLVGAGVDYLEVRRVRPFAYGATLWDGLIALVPRLVWPDKPVVAGSGGLVSDFTGWVFAENTSVGIGHVLEFYVNFGSPGVVLGFLALGVAVTAADHGAGVRLRRGDWRGFALWYLPGLTLLQVGGSLVELTSGAGAALAVAVLVNRFVLDAGREPLTDWSAAPLPRRRLAGAAEPPLVRGTTGE